MQKIPLRPNEAASLRPYDSTIDPSGPAAVKPWTVAALLVGAALYAASLSQAFYELTSPSYLSWHVLLRKTYSIVAFATVGYLLRRALAENGATKFVVPCIAGVALYSALIEVGQFFAGSKEGLAWNAFDTACGAAGGLIAVADRLRTERLSGQTVEKM
jgi:hypothetical protein